VILWLKFRTLDIVGTRVQLLVLHLLLKLHMNYLAATPLAVEEAILHDYSPVAISGVQRAGFDLLKPGANAPVRRMGGNSGAAGELSGDRDYFRGEFLAWRPVGIWSTKGVSRLFHGRADRIAGN
jgi:hypothetical protein